MSSRSHSGLRVLRTTAPTRVNSTVFRGLLVWLLIMLVETIHGMLRGLLVAPRIGEEAAGRIGWPVGMILVFTVSFLAIRWTGIRGRWNLLGLGALWAALTFGFEIMIGLLRGLTTNDIIAEINPMAGGLMAYSLAVMLFAPLDRGAPSQDQVRDHRPMRATPCLPSSRFQKTLLPGSFARVKQKVRPSYHSCHFWHTRSPDTHQRPLSLGDMYLPRPTA